MNNKYAKSKFDYLDALFHDFDNQNLDEYVKSHIAKYLTVLVSGIYEDMIKKILVEFIQKDVISKETKQFIFNNVENKFRNPSFRNLKGFLNGFNKEWVKKLNEKINETNKDALNAIVSNKNLIAHGDSSTITLSEIKQFYADSRVIFEELDKIII